jgi:hypothetical protein
METRRLKTLPLMKVTAGAMAFMLSWGVGLSVNAQTKTIENIKKEKVINQVPAATKL